jgi:LPXTG-motif cell wall-anchored protein
MNIGTILVGLAFAAIAFFVIRRVKNGSIK